MKGHDYQDVTWRHCRARSDRGPHLKLSLANLTTLPSPLPSPHLCISDIRETAFVYAITAAGVAHAVTQACSMGELLQCGCEATRSRAPPRPPGGAGGDGVKWEWGGCGDDVEFGYEKSKQFMDAKRKKGKSDIRTLIDLHNNEAGRLVCLMNFS